MRSPFALPLMRGWGAPVLGERLVDRVVERTIEVGDITVRDSASQGRDYEELENLTRHQS